MQCHEDVFHKAASLVSPRAALSHYCVASLSLVCLSPANLITTGEAALALALACEEITLPLTGQISAVEEESHH